MRKAFQYAILLVAATALALHARLLADTGAQRQAVGATQDRLDNSRHNTNALRQLVAQAEKHAAASVPAAAPAVVATETAEAAKLKQQRARKFLEGEVEEVRGLKFLQPVVYRSIKSSELGSFLKKKIHEAYTPGEMKDYSRSLAMIGLVPDGVDFEATVMEVMGEQVAAFYDQDKAELYTFSDSPMTGNMNRMIVSHEMTHALQDQHFHIKKWPLKRKDNDDLVSAHMAVLEGDATVAMTKIFMRTASLATALTDIAGALGQGTEKFLRAPAYFREMLMFPYQEGQAFIMQLFQAGGMDLVNRAFHEPPTSTAQILHPKKYYPQRQEPMAVTAEVKVESGWRRLANNVVGEYGLVVLLRQFGHTQDAVSIAAGWRGDRYAAFDTGQGRGLLAWRSAWESGDAARRFADAYHDVVAKRNTHRAEPLEIQARIVDKIVDVTLRVPSSATKSAGAP